MLSSRHRAVPGVLVYEIHIYFFHSVPRAAEILLDRGPGGSSNIVGKYLGDLEQKKRLKMN